MVKKNSIICITVIDIGEEFQFVMEPQAIIFPGPHIIEGLETYGFHQTEVVIKEEASWRMRI